MTCNNASFLALSFLLVACGGAGKNLPSHAGGTEAKLATGIGLSAEELGFRAENAAQELIESLGRQATFAMLGWQVGPDYEPSESCFNFWYEGGDARLSAEQIADCEQHAKDLSRLYASYNVEAAPLVFKSKYYWAQQKEHGLAWPELVKAWEAAGGQKEDASYLEHPNCVEPLQVGWAGSEYFYDGDESPICRSHKIEAIENRYMHLGSLLGRKQTDSLNYSLRKLMPNTPASALVQDLKIEIMEAPDVGPKNEVHYLYTASVLESYRGKLEGKVRYVLIGEADARPETKTEPYLVALCKGREAFYLPSADARLRATAETVYVAKVIGQSLDDKQPNYSSCE